MQRISRAPELSATLSLDSCWIIALPRLLHYVDQAPALGLGERPRLDDPNHVALAGLVALVVRVQLGRAAHDLLVSAVTAGDVDADRDRFVALAGDDDPLTDLGGVRLALRRRGAGPGGAFSLRGLALLTAQIGPDPPFLGPLGDTILGAELRPGRTRAPRFLQPTPLLPRKVVLRVRLGRGSLFGGRSLLGRSLLHRWGLLRSRGLLRGSLVLRCVVLRRLSLRLFGGLVFFLLVVAHIRRVSF